MECPQTGRVKEGEEIDVFYRSKVKRWSVVTCGLYIEYTVREGSIDAKAAPVTMPFIRNVNKLTFPSGQDLFSL